MLFNPVFCSESVFYAHNSTVYPLHVHQDFDRKGPRDLWSRRCGKICSRDRLLSHHNIVSVNVFCRNRPVTSFPFPLPLDRTQKQCFQHLPFRSGARNSVSSVFPFGVVQETAFPASSRLEWCQKQCFQHLPVRSDARNSVSSTFPVGVTQETVFPASSDKECSRYHATSLSRRFSRQCRRCF